MALGVLTFSACLCQSLQVQVLGLLSLAMGLGHGPGQAQYLGLNHVFFTTLSETTLSESATQLCPCQVSAVLK